MPRQHITSRHNPRVKEAAKLRLHRQREKQGRFLIDGGREILRALAAGIEIVEAFVCEPLCTGADAKLAAERLFASSAESATVVPEAFEKLCFGERHDGVIAVAATPHHRLQDLQLSASPLIAVIEGVEKPGNIGAVLRSADGAGVDAVIVVDPQCDLYHASVIRASLGTLFSLAVREATADETLAWLKANHLAVVAARPDAEKSYADVDYRRGVAIVLGSESQGLTQRWQAPQVESIRLPMRGAADSLNVSATAAVLFYEAQRQRSRSQTDQFGIDRNTGSAG